MATKAELRSAYLKAVHDRVGIAEAAKAYNDAPDDGVKLPFASSHPGRTKGNRQHVIARAQAVFIDPRSLRRDLRLALGNLLEVVK